MKLYAYLSFACNGRRQEVSTFHPSLRNHVTSLMVLPWKLFLKLAVSRLYLCISLQ